MGGPSAYITLPLSLPELFSGTGSTDQENQKACVEHDGKGLSAALLFNRHKVVRPHPLISSETAAGGHVGAYAAPPLNQASMKRR